MDVRRALNLLAGFTPRAQAPPRRTPPKVVLRNLRRILRRELSTPAQRFRDTGSAATVSVFYNLLPQRTKLLFASGSCAGDGLMGGVNE
jgi:hypothetical protein